MLPDQPFEFVKLKEDKQGLHFGFFIDKKLDLSLFNWVLLFVNKDGCS
jgi:hypothetical protein